MWKNDFKIYIKDNEFDIDEEDFEKEFEEWCYNNIDDYWSCDYEVLKDAMEGKKYRIDANLGLWYGRVKAHKIVNGIDAIDDCIGRDTDSLEIYEERGTLKLKCYHHDGVNYFTIKEITPKGLRSPHLHKKIFGA